MIEWPAYAASCRRRAQRASPSSAAPTTSARIGGITNCRFEGGGSGKVLFAHIAEYCDGWMPIGGAGIAASLPLLRAALDARGRDSSSVRIVPFGTVPSPGKLDYYVSIGVREVVLRIPSAARDEVLSVLDTYAPYV